MSDNANERKKYVEEFAPAKINLSLHVGPRISNVRHLLQSIAAFADVGDRLIIEENEGVDEFLVTGPFAPDLVNEKNNLVIRALSLIPKPSPIRVTLDKCLPIASGIGGGSADGAAALRAARTFYNMKMSDGDLEALVTDLGADMPVCIRSRSTLMTGSGGTVLTPIQLPRLCAVLINPGVQVPTGSVFRRFDSMGICDVLEHSIPSNANTTETIDALSRARNDLEAPAIELVPEIKEVLTCLRADSRVRLARMSGSGATCFGLVDDFSIAQNLVQLLSEEHTQWWITATQLCIVQVSSVDV